MPGAVFIDGCAFPQPGVSSSQQLSVRLTILHSIATVRRFIVEGTSDEIASPPAGALWLAMVPRKPSLPDGRIDR